MRRAHQRGTALPETALTIGLALLLVLGAAQVAILSFAQVSADAGAFIAAHAVAANPSASPLAIVQSVFPNIKNVSTLNVSTTVDQATVTMTAGGFNLPGYPSAYTVKGSDLEVAPAAIGQAAQTYTYSNSATLFNYCPRGVNNCSFSSSYQMYLAQTFSTGNGTNGVFAEWNCHEATFEKVNFPTNRPAAGNKWDPTSTQSGAEYNIYSWDSGTPCS